MKYERQEWVETLDPKVTTEISSGRMRHIEDALEYIFTRLGDKNIKGDPGTNGVDGVDGRNGRDGIDGQNGRDGYSPIKGIDYFDGVDGKDGFKGEKGDPGKNAAQIELRKGQTHLQWRYLGGKWMNLISLVELKGEKGDKGNRGDTGKTPVKGIDF